jgi:hypothetical protein
MPWLCSARPLPDHKQRRIPCPSRTISPPPSARSLPRFSWSTACERNRVKSTTRGDRAARPQCDRERSSASGPALMSRGVCPRRSRQSPLCADLETGVGVYRSILRRWTAESRLPRNPGKLTRRAEMPLQQRKRVSTVRRRLVQARPPHAPSTRAGVATARCENGQLERDSPWATMRQCCSGSAELEWSSRRDARYVMFSRWVRTR